jgi:hypothetical protein
VDVGQKDEIGWGKTVPVALRRVDVDGLAAGFDDETSSTLRAAKAGNVSRVAARITAVRFIFKILL